MTMVWTALVIAVAVPIATAAMSPLLAWRDPIYITAGFAGVIAMAIMLCQPLLAAGYLPGLSSVRGRNAHRRAGTLLIFAVFIHVAGLWITSPPDVIDALLFTSPTPFSIWGVIAMWCVFAVAGLVLLRRRLRLNPHTWRLTHKTMTTMIVVGSVVHAMLIEGTMGTLTKAVLCVMVLVITLIVLVKLSRRS